MTRESKPTLTPSTALSSRENETFSRFLSVSDRDPVFAFSCVKSFITNADLIQEARTLPSGGTGLPEGQVLKAAADLVNDEVIFVLDVDKQTEAAMQQHLIGQEVSSMRKIKGYLGELAAHHLHLESRSLQSIAMQMIEQDYAEFSTDSDLYVTVLGSRPDLDAA
jgi:hypothetical protein